MAHHRVQQWATMARTWWIYDASHQCAFRSAKLIVPYLQGQHKPIYHPISDVGDHVVVFNTRHIAMKDERWRKFTFHHHTRYAGGASKTSAWRLHAMDPTRLLHKCVYSRIPGNLLRPNMMMRLHLFPDEDIPEEVLKNVSDQIRQVQPIPKRLDQFSPEEIAAFPKVFDWPENHVISSGKRTVSDPQAPWKSK